MDHPTGAPAIGLLEQSMRLARRRFELLPLRGPGAAFTEAQARLPGDSTTPEELADLISSIARVGVLQPILVEEIERPPGPPLRRLVAGERRLRACRWGAAHHDSPHFDAIPAVCCPGPLSEEERRRWQLLENFAREDLQPGELAAALLLERCALATGKLLAAGRPVPAVVHQMEDPVGRWQALERLRGDDTELGAPWLEVLRRLGLQLSARKARELVRAFAALPRDLSADMDEAKVRLHTRITFARLHEGRAAAAEEIWAAVKTSDPTLLGPAVQACLHEELPPDDAVEQAVHARERANLARGEALRDRHHPTDDQPSDDQPSDDQPSDDQPSDDQPSDDQPSDDRPSDDRPSGVPPGLVGEVRRTLGTLLTALRAGAQLHRYDRGSLQLLTDELRLHLEHDPAAALPRAAHSRQATDR